MSSDTTFDCPSCEDTFDTKRGVSGHHVRAHGESIAKKTVECERCGSEEEIYPSRREDAEKFFCSKDCRAEYYGDEYRERVTVECFNCGDTYEVTPSRDDNGRNFCTRKCLSEWHSNRSGEGHPLYDKVTVECDWCSEEFERCPSNCTTENQFCSLDCRDEWYSGYIEGDNHPRWKEGADSVFGPNWQEQRELAIERDFGRCRLCNMSREEHYEKFGRDIEVHHKTPRRYFDDLKKADRLNNLITLCKTHHMKIEHEHFGGVRE